MVREVGRGGRCHRAHCVECGIWFLTGRCNRTHKNLSCPFGCAQARGRRLSAKRSRIYYRSPEGKKKKRELNLRRDRRQKSKVPRRISTFPSATLLRHAIFIVGLCRATHCPAEIVRFLQEAVSLWRQLSLACFEISGYWVLEKEEKHRWPP